MSICWKNLPALAILALAVAFAACTPVKNPATGQINYTSLSLEDEIALGREQDPKVKSEFGGEYRDPLLIRYIDGIGNRLKANSELSDLDFTFTVLDSPVVNAFALPGGFVYISRGLLALAENEAEIAGVLGHEIGHVTARHTAQRYDRAVAGRVGSQIIGVLGAIGGAYIGGQAGAKAGGQLAGGLADVGAQAWVKGFSRAQEFQADQLGVRYLTRTNYDPHGMSSFLGALQANDAYRQRIAGDSGGSGGDVPTWLRSHPRTADRVERAADEAAVALRDGGVTNRDALLNAIDGMIYGDSPAQGFVLEQTFFHPALRFEFTLPSNMKLVNTPSAVIGKGERIQMLFNLGEHDGANLADYLQNELTSETRLNNVRRIDVGGRQGAAGFAKGRTRRGAVGIMVVALDGPGDRVYQFQFAGMGDISAADRADFDDIMASLKDLSGAQAAGLKPLRIKIVDVRPGQGIDDFARMMDVDEFKRDLFMTLNGLGRGRQLRAGERVKIIVRG